MNSQLNSKPVNVKLMLNTALEKKKTPRIYTKNAWSVRNTTATNVFILAKRSNVKLSTLDNKIVLKLKSSTPLLISKIT
jgi:hypothetical protein